MTRIFSFFRLSGRWGCTGLGLAEGHPRKSGVNIRCCRDVNAGWKRSCRCSTLTVSTFHAFGHKKQLWNFLKHHKHVRGEAEEAGDCLRSDLLSSPPWLLQTSTVSSFLLTFTFNFDALRSVRSWWGPRSWNWKLSYFYLTLSFSRVQGVKS